MNDTGQTTPLSQRRILNKDLKQQKQSNSKDFEVPFESAPENELPRPNEECTEPWDLSLVYSPETALPRADFVFIHGLWGDQVRTWCYKRKRKYFWLRGWLPLHPELKRARIWTFGYDSNFLSMGPENVSDISDFARSLLIGLKLSAQGHPTEYQVPIGKVSFAICW